MVRIFEEPRVFGSSGFSFLHGAFPSLESSGCHRGNGCFIIVPGRKGQQGFRTTIPALDGEKGDSILLFWCFGVPAPFFQLKKGRENKGYAEHTLECGYHSRVEP